MFKVRIYNEGQTKSYRDVDIIGLDKNGLILMNEYTENKLAVPITKETMIIIFPEKTKEACKNEENT